MTAKGVKTTVEPRNPNDEVLVSIDGGKPFRYKRGMTMSTTNAQEFLFTTVSNYPVVLEVQRRWANGVSP